MLVQDDDGDDPQADDDDHSGEDEEGIDSANSNVQYPSPRKSSSPAQHYGAPHMGSGHPQTGSGQPQILVNLTPWILHHPGNW